MLWVNFFSGVFLIQQNSCTKKEAFTIPNNLSMHRFQKLNSEKDINTCCQCLVLVVVRRAVSLMTANITQTRHTINGLYRDTDFYRWGVSYIPPEATLWKFHAFKILFTVNSDQKLFSRSHLNSVFVFVILKVYSYFIQEKQSYAVVVYGFQCLFSLVALSLLAI